MADEPMEMPSESQPMSITEAVQYMQAASNFCRHILRLHDAGFAIMQAQQGSEDLMRLRDSLTKDVARLKEQQQTLTADLERDRRVYQSDEKRLQEAKTALMQQITAERAKMGDEFDAWKANLNIMKAEAEKEHQDFLAERQAEKMAAEQQLTALHAQLEDLRNKFKQMMG